LLSFEASSRELNPFPMMPSAKFQDAIRLIWTRKDGLGSARPSCSQIDYDAGVLAKLLLDTGLRDETLRSSAE